jgi:hypothetical protein
VQARHWPYATAPGGLPQAGQQRVRHQRVGRQGVGRQRSGCGERWQPGGWRVSVLRLLRKGYWTAPWGPSQLRAWRLIAGRWLAAGCHQHPHPHQLRHSRLPGSASRGR